MVIYSIGISSGVLLPAFLVNPDGTNLFDNIIPSRIPSVL